MPKKPPNRKPWFKVYSDEWLEGSIRFDCTEGERGIFTDLMALANKSRQRGIIQANPDTPYPHAWIAGKLNTSLPFFEQCLAKFTQQKRIFENSDGIHIINFKYYQEQLYKKNRLPGEDDDKCPICHRSESECGGHEKEICGDDLS